MSNKKTEQSSKVNAEETLPKFPIHVHHHPRLLTEVSDEVVPNVMCFYSPDGSVFQGLVLHESADSFLVGTPARLRMNADRKVTAEEITVQPMIRVFKANIHYMAVPTELTLFHYFAFLEEFAYNKLPYYFTEGRKEYISFVRSDIRFKVPMDLTPHETKPEAPGDNIHSFTPHSQSESIH